MSKNRLIAFHIDTLYQYSLGNLERDEVAERYGLWLKEDVDKIKEVGG